MTAALGICSALLHAAVSAQAADPGDNALVLALGPSVDIDTSSGSALFGAEVDLELDLVEGWLEVEVGAEAVGGAGSQQLSAGILFKVPFPLAPRLSVMVGVGPQVVSAQQGAQSVTRGGVELAADFMWWIFSDHVGLGAEPTVGLTFGPLRSSAGLTVGPIFGWSS